MEVVIVFHLMDSVWLKNIGHIGKGLELVEFS